jgi:hypothetical protein
MAGRRTFDLKDGTEWCVTKPWKVIEGHELLDPCNEEPNPVGGDVRDLNR